MHIGVPTFTQMENSVQNQFSRNPQNPYTLHTLTGYKHLLYRIHFANSIVDDQYFYKRVKTYVKKIA
jgi:hypothetical protein